MSFNLGHPPVVIVQNQNIANTGWPKK